MYAIFKVNKIKKSFFSQGIGQILRLFAKIFLGAWIARYLGVEEFGKLSYALALVGILSPLGGLGTKPALSAILCKTDTKNSLIASGLFIEIIGRISTSIFLIPIILLTKDIILKLLIIIIMFGNFAGVSEVFEVELLNQEKGKRIGSVSIYQTLFDSSIYIFAILLKANVLIFGFINSLALFFRALLLAITVQRIKFWKTLKLINIDHSKLILKKGLPLLLSGLSIALYMRSDQVLIEWIKGPKEVGIYSVAVRICESLYFLPVILANTYLPKIGNEINLNEKLNTTRELFKASWILGLIMTTLSITLFRILIPYIFGNEFLDSGQTLLFLAPSAFAVSLGCASNTWLNLNDKVNLILKKSIFGAILNIFLNLFLIPSFGFNGAAIATTIAQFSSIFSIAILDKKCRLHIKQLIFPF